MTSGAIDFRGRNIVGLGVIPGVRFHALLNFCVAFQAFQPPVAGPEIVATRTLRYALQLLMRTRERSGRDLSGRDAAQPEQARRCGQ